SIALPLEKATPEPSFVTASIPLDAESVVATGASLVARPFARRAGHLIIGCNTVAPLLMKWRLLAWKASTSRPPVEPNESLGIPFIVGWKELLLGVVGSTIEGSRISLERNFKPTRSEPSSVASNNRSGCSPWSTFGLVFGHRPWLANEATKTRWCCFGICLDE